MSEEKVFEIGDRVKTTDKYNKMFNKECRGIIIEIQNMSSVNYPSFCAVISAKDKLEYVNFDWLELVE